MKRLVFASLAGLFVSPVIFACGADDEISRTVDCAEICSKYSECLTDIDTTDCTDYCEDQADANESIEQAAADCEDCIDDRSCAEATQCIPSCALVPTSGGS